MKSLIPAELDICLSNRCNLRCGYCYAVSADKGGEHRMNAAMLKLGVLQYLRHVEARDIKKVRIAGGEPLMEKKLLAAAVPWLRRALGPQVKMECVSNGTLLDAGAAAFFRDHGVRLTVSLDGEAASHDRNRVTRGRGPSFARVMGNIDALPAGLRRGLGINCTVTKSTLPDLAGNIAFLCSLGTHYVGLDFAVAEAWSAADLALLRRGLKKAGAYFAAGGGGVCPKPLFMYRSLKAGKKAERDFCRQGEISLGPDGFFYPCGNISPSLGRQAARFQELYSVGDVRSGLSPEKLGRSRREAFRKLLSLKSGDYLFNQTYTYYINLLLPGDLGAIMRANAAICGVLRKESAMSEEI